jgi:hypothetical protein
LAIGCVIKSRRDGLCRGRTVDLREQKDKNRDSSRARHAREEFRFLFSIGPGSKKKVDSLLQVRAKDSSLYGFVQFASGRRRKSADVESSPDQPLRLVSHLHSRQLKGVSHLFMAKKPEFKLFCIVPHAVSGAVEIME